MIPVKRLCYLAIAICVSCSDDDNDPVSLLNDDITSSAGWDYVNTANHVGALDATVFSSPQNSLKIAVVDNKADGFSFWHHLINTADVHEGAKLTLRVKVKTDNVTNDGVFVALRCDNNSQILAFETTEDKITINGTTDFVEHTVEINSVPKDTNTIRVFLIMNGNSTGTAYFDDVSVSYKH
jgi:hypothetical protein